MLSGIAEHALRPDYDFLDYAELWFITSDGSTFIPTHTQDSSSSASSTKPIGSASSTSALTTSISSIPSTDGVGNVVGSSSGVPTVSTTPNSINSESASNIVTTILTSIPSTVTSPSTAFMTLIPTTITITTDFLTLGTSLPDTGSLSTEVQSICIGDGVDAYAVGTLATLVLPSVVGLVIWLVFAVIRPQFRQVYNVREWFPPQDLRPRPLVPKQAVIAVGAIKDFPSDGQLSQRVLWISFLIVLGWSLIGLGGALPLYLVNTPCLAQSARVSFVGYYSTIQDLSLLRLLQLLEQEDFTTPNRISRAVVNGNDISSTIRIRLIVLTVLVLVLGMLPALYKLMKEYTRLLSYRRHWLEIRCGGMEMGWLSARNAPGLVGWGEKRIKDFIIKSGLSASLDRNGGIGTSGNMAGIGSGYRARYQSQRNRSQDEQGLSDDEKASLQIDIASIFSIGDTGELSSLIAERDSILENLEIAETRYIASFRLTTPDPSVAELPMPPEDENSIKRHISRPKTLTSPNHIRTRRGRQKASSSSIAPTSYVAPSQFYRLRNVRGISNGRILSQSGDGGSYGDGPSFGDSVRSRIVGSRFQEFSRDHTRERLPIGSRIALHQGELGPIPDVPISVYGPNHGLEPSSGNEADTETYLPTGSPDAGTSRGASGIDGYAATILLDPSLNHFSYKKNDSSPSGDGPSDSGVGESGSQGQRRQFPRQHLEERRETFPMRYRSEEMHNEAQVPLHLRLQPQGPFVRPLSGLDHDDLGAVYVDIREWRTKLKQINVEISDAQNDCYNDIADGARIKGWLITGRGLRFLPGIELIEGRSKDDILWDELQNLIAVAGLAIATAPNVAHYLPFFQPLVNSKDKIGTGIATTLIPAVVATIFFIMAIEVVQYAARYIGAISVSSAQLMTFKAIFFILIAAGVMWLTAVGAVVFAADAFALSSERPSTVANGSIYMSAFFLALIINVAIIAPGLLILQPARLRNVLWYERRAITPRQRFRALYPGVYNPTYAMACCIFAVFLASTFSFIFPLIGPAVIVLLFLTIIAHRFLVGYVYGRTEAPTGGLLQIWLLKRFATVVSFQPILLGLIFLTRRLFIEGGILVGCGFAAIVAVELYTRYKTRLPGKGSLSAATLNALNTFTERVGSVNQNVLDSEGTPSLVSAPRMRQRGSMSSVLDMMSLTLAVMPPPHQARGAVPLETESLDDLIATERAARTHPDAPPHLPPLPFADHAEEMAGILYAPELIAPPPMIWLPNDAAGTARSEAYDLQRYHNLRTTLEIRSPDDAPRRSSSRQRDVS
ncbi:hypothetical protein EW145_g2508 [Phellinidium pouzarii]|uniref:CSC1/OSCA1-like 7TM region domain-containing protein n=1 Tax=Phellinidium pouzarii TaxID=167371 RepID=A0A4V3XD79_9AGAM|nr:hypothetical protein EW145_g2508 [Phellinidium pouzarii]